MSLSCDKPRATIGSQIAFYHQRPAFLRIGRREPRPSNAIRERLALNIMYLDQVDADAEVIILISRATADLLPPKEEDEVGDMP